jgi:hypothetical protein
MSDLKESPLKHKNYNLGKIFLSPLSSKIKK